MSGMLFGVVSFV